MKPIIEVKNLYKKYRFSQKKPYLTLRESLVEFIKKPFRTVINKNTNEKSKNEFWALKDISFNVQPGESIGIIGRNGAGKSTLLKVLSRITPPTGGEILLRGRVASLLEIGTGFHQELTGRENIYLNGALLGMRQKEIKRKFDEIVDFSEIEKFLETPVKYYSSGMYMRLAFAVAAHLDSEILLVDEVLAVGDGAFQKKCLGKMESVTNLGRTVIFVSHNMGAIRNLCHRSILLDSGRLISDAQTEKTLNIYHKILNETKIDDNKFIDNPTVRRGSGIVRFTHIELQDINGKKRFDFNMGDTVRFKLSYKTFNDMQGLAIYIALRSGITREIITSFQHKISSERIMKNTIGTVIIEIPDINLRPGEYPLYLHISEINGKKMNFDVLDDLTLPLVITDKESYKNPEFSQTQTTGYFSLPSKLILNEINPK